MKKAKLTAYYSFLLAFVFGAFTACERNSDERINTEFSKTNIALTGAQETPPTPTSALGSMDVFYSKETRMLTYTVRWSGLTDSLLLMHIHGLAPRGFAAGVVQNIVNPSNSIFPQRTAGKLTFGKSGTISGSLLVDGVVVKEDDLLNGMFYMNIHTSVYPGGEIRGQITFD